MLWLLAFVLAFVCVFHQTSLVQSEKVLRVIPGVESHLEFLRELEKGHDFKVDFWKAPSHLFKPVDIEVSEGDLGAFCNILKEHGITFDVHIDDVQQLLDRALAPVGARSVSGWHSIYHNLTEIVSKLREVSGNHAGSNFVSLISMGKSHEGRNMQALKINGKQRCNKPVFFIECGIHAREWISPATCMYMIDQMTQKYGKDSSVTALLDKMDFIVLPVVNVDGYAYTWINQSKKRYRLWRKNRRYHDRFRCHGVDLNRNWGYEWGGTGASPYHCDLTFRGDRPFSEVETRNIRDYLTGLGGRLKGFIDFHAYSQMWFTPWGFKEERSPDFYEQVRVARVAANALRRVHQTRFQFGSSAALLYPASGGSEDWTYGELGVKYSFSVELRDEGQYGFLLPADQIIPTGEETFEGLKALVREMNF